MQTRSYQIHYVLLSNSSYLLNFLYLVFKEILMTISEYTSLIAGIFNILLKDIYKLLFLTIHCYIIKIFSFNFHYMLSPNYS